jgi:glycosyltransferase involved in cell wall biosynthesis
LQNTIARSAAGSTEDKGVSAAVDVSVVVATRNRAAFLPAAIQSLLAQTSAARFEVVVVDNGSRDTTAEVISDLAQNDPRIRTIAEPTVGLSHAKNAGIRAAQGRLILFTDDDVVVEDGWITAYTDFFGRSRGDVIVAGGPVLPVPQDLSEWPRWIGASALADLPSLFYGAAERRLRASEWLWGANMAAPRDLLESLNAFRTDLGRGAGGGTFEDVDLVDRLRDAGGQAWYCPSATVKHRVDVAKARPSEMLLTAFNRGCNNRISLRNGGYFEPALSVPKGRLATGLALPGLLVALLASAASFRLTGRPRFFDFARRSSWGAGWCMWSVIGESSRKHARILRSIVLAVRRVAFRMIGT